MNLETLEALAPAPKSGVEKLDWDKWEGVLGTKLPTDYKDLADTYGIGCFADFLWVYLPEPNNTTVDLIYQIQAKHGILSIFKSHREEFPENFPYAFYPEPDGLLPFGELETYDILCWRTKGHPDDWGIVILSTFGDISRDFEMGIVEFLVGIFQKSLEADELPKDYIDPSAGFIFD